jgi:hypothetical protein
MYSFLKNAIKVTIDRLIDDDIVVITERSVDDD